MEKALVLLLQKYMLRYKSIPFVCLLGFFALLPHIPRNNKPLDIDFYLWLSGIMVSILVYVVITIMRCKLPCAKNGKAGVLFIISSENDDQYLHVKHCLAEEFKQLITRLPQNNIEVVCISSEDIKNIDTSNVKQMTSLLVRTNCWFNVFTKYSTDDVKQAEDFEMSINYGMLHPGLQPQGKDFLQNELDQFAMGVCRQSFKRHELLQTFNATALTLCFICEYFLGISIILDRDIYKANMIFIDIADQILASKLMQRPFYRKILDTVRKRIYETCLHLEKAELDEFEETRDKQHLIRYREILEKSNCYLPETYGYYLDSAMLTILLDGNSKLASQYVNKCREIVERNDWKYSDAFIAAYENRNPLIVYRKYKAAFKSEFNILLIIDFIECLLEEEPHRGSLHLSLILCYKEVGDFVLMHRHIARYEEWDKNGKQNEEIYLIINQYKQEHPCPNLVDCDKMCIRCN